MKNIIKAIPVALSLLVAVSASAQTAKPTTAASSAQKPAMTKQDRVNDANKKIADWQQKIDAMKAKDAKNPNVAKLQNDLTNYKTAVTTYSSANGDQEKTAETNLKSAHEKFIADWKAANPGATKATTTPAPKM